MAALAAALAAATPHHPTTQLILIPPASGSELLNTKSRSFLVPHSRLFYLLPFKEQNEGAQAVHALS
ncbi:predicted protein [Lichtheimia corymbifera JMRC:FSU:9682]|uniref:Uncharacterized protein n=1 Tax=Lichtheimia corymbifera JMRC:FSU:9682 TaxID=1263082 RepID=A0A068S5C0_9FUNG|nr:predicted protein [Lichtheimia corymbifera JMRC:FSU:9682]